MPGTISSFQVLVQTIILFDVYNDYPHFTNGKSEAQGGLVTRQRIHRQEGTKLRFKTRDANWRAGSFSPLGYMSSQLVAGRICLKGSTSPLSPGQVPVLPKRKTKPCQGLYSLPISS